MTGKSAYGSWRDLMPLGTVIAMGILLAVSTFIVTRAYYASLERQQFRRSATYYETKFKDDVARHVTSLAAIRAFVSATRGVTRWEFSAYANQILPLNAGFRAVLWVPKVAATARPSYEAGLQSDGLYGLRIHELDSQGLVIATRARASYLPISYVEPFEGNDGLVGLDLSAVPSLGQLFHDAEAMGRVAASAPMSRAIVAGAQGPTILLAFPVSAASAKGISGFALGVLQLQSVLDEALGPTAGPMQAALASAPSPSGAPRLLSSPVTATAWLTGAALNHSTPIDIAGRHFQLLLRATSHQDPVTIFYVPAGAALLVLALTTLLAQTMFATLLRKVLVERAVVARTAQLRAANESLRDEVEHRRQAEQDLRIARDLAERASRAKSSFLSIMSHELRTPLNAIIGFSSLLTQSAAAPKREEYAHEILGGGQRLLAIINDILDLTEMMSKREQQDQGLVYPADCIAAVIAEHQAAARTGGVTLKVVTPADLPALHADNKRICRALSHLVANAIKFAPEGGVAVIAARRDPDRALVLEVMDDGCGMSAEAQDRIRDAFSQSDNRLGRRHEGLGLGLTYVSKVAEFHHARFDLSSEVGKGTCARLVFAPDRLSQTLEVA